MLTNKIIAFTATEWAMLMTAFGALIQATVASVGVYILVYFQLKYRRTGDPPVDISQQVTDLKDALSKHTDALIETIPAPTIEEKS